MRQQLKMSAWPYVTQENTGGDTSYAWRVQNSGLGPALVRHATITIDGRPMQDWGGFWMTMLRVDSAQLRERLRTVRTMQFSSVVHGSVLLPASTTELIRVQGPFAREQRRMLNDPRVRIQICYCSLYDDCWTSDNKAVEPTPTRACASGDDFQS